MILDTGGIKTDLDTCPMVSREHIEVTIIVLAHPYCVIANEDLARAGQYKRYKNAFIQFYLWHN